MSLHRLLGFRVAVPDPGALAAFYAEVGLAGDATTGFTGSDGGAAVRIEEGPIRRLRSVEIGCEDERDLAEVRARLDAVGTTTSGGTDGVTVVDPASQVRFTVAPAPPEERRAGPAAEPPNRPGAATRVNRRAPAVFGEPQPPRRLGHLVIGTPDLTATRELLVEGLGFKVSDELPGLISFLRCSTDHHNVALVGSEVPLLQHYSWECDDIDHVGHTATALLRADPARHVWGLGRHFAGSNFYWYLRDPAGSFLELYSDLDCIVDDDAWEREGRTEFGFDHVANAWGPDLPPEFIVPADLDELRAGWV